MSHGFGPPARVSSRLQGGCGPPVVEQGDGLEGGAVAGPVVGGDAQLVDDGEPLRPGGVVTAQAVDHRDGRGHRAEAGGPVGGRARVQASRNRPLAAITSVAWPARASAIEEP